MTALINSPNLDDVDGIYQRLIDLHENLTDAQSARVNARLILALINHIGDREAVLGAIALAGLPQPGAGEKHA